MRLAVISLSPDKPSGDSETRRLFAFFSVALLSSALVSFLLESVAFLAAAAALSIFFTLSLLCTRFFGLLAGISNEGTSGRFERVRDPMDLQVRRLVGLAMVMIINVGGY
jgi:uncharacterized membrane protein YbhN (UPF0104 family)